MQFKDNLKFYREKQSISAKELAECINVPYTTYLNYENKGSEPKYEVLCKIAAILHVSIDELLGYEGKATDWIESKLKPALCNTAIKVDGIQPDGTILLLHIDKGKEIERWTYSMDELREYYEAAEREAEQDKRKRVSELLYRSLLELALLQSIQ